MNQRTSRIEAIIVLAIAAMCLLWASSSHGAEAAPKPIIATMNNYQAYAATVTAAHQAKADQCDSKVRALKESADKCKDDICRVLFGVLVDKSCEQSAGNAQTVVAQAPPVEKTWYGELKDTFFDLARVGLPVLDRVMTSRDNRSARESSERQNIALYGTFGNMFSTGTAAVKDTALGGFGALERGAAAAWAAQKDTYTINIDGSSDLALFGSTINKTNNCYGTSGNGGNGGNSAPGGQGGTNGSGGSNTAGAGAPSGSAPCTITK